MAKELIDTTKSNGVDLDSESQLKGTQLPDGEVLKRASLQNSMRKKHLPLQPISPFDRSKVKLYRRHRLTNSMFLNSLAPVQLIVDNACIEIRRQA